MLACSSPLQPLLPTATLKRPPSTKTKPFPLPKTPPFNNITTQSPPSSSSHLHHTHLLLESYHHNKLLRKLIDDLSQHASDPLYVLHRHGDWSPQHLWTALRFLRYRGYVHHILKVFDAWTQRDSSRINGANCSRIVRILCEEGAVREAIVVLEDMERRGLPRPVSSYNSVVSCLASEGELDGAIGTIGKMREIGVVPNNESYKPVIQAYGDRRMYDEMSKCVKKMALDGCCPDEGTYNLLIVEYARGRLLERMEGLCRTLMSKRMVLRPSTMVEMVEAYAELGMVEKMEKVLKRFINCKGVLKESSTRKVATAFVKNYRFARLEEFGIQIGSMTGRTPFVWCMILLASACLLSCKGMKSVSQEMERDSVEMTVTYVNIVASAYLKMKDFGELDALLCRIGERNIKPDMVTVGLLFDGCEVGYDCTKALETWRRHRFLDETAEINTDALVLEAFGKGSFLRRCEKIYAVLDDKAKERRRWRYRDLINLVFSKKKSE